MVLHIYIVLAISICAETLAAIMIKTSEYFIFLLYSIGGDIR